ncbi:MAG: Holliday junction branch migration protein RuvA [Holosporales bacterium]|jgi:Holliday junction DNA helicase RuvA|nr:Holliday junction branch migration protein RuvA [Holosporales bacterium]
MIARLSGIVNEVHNDSVVIDVNGIGYSVFISNKTGRGIKIGTAVSLKICHIFKQETQYLCGFQDEEEISLFRALLDVHGIGVKSAMTILSTFSVEELATAVATQDSTILCKAGGVGKKTAERILLELKDKTMPKIKDIHKHDNENINDAVLGLMSLGYQKATILKIIGDISKKCGPNASTNELIVSTLKKIR